MSKLPNLAAALCLVALAGQAAPASAQQVGDAISLKDREACSPAIGRGGNLVTRGETLAGKCEGRGQPPALKDRGTASVLTFEVPPGDPVRLSRTELAYTDRRFHFGQPVKLSFEAMVPSNSQQTDTWYYAIQFWQGGGPAPFAGLRMNRGSSHAASIIVRDDDNVPGTRVARIELKPGRWVPITMRALVNPGGTSLLSVTADGATSDWSGKMAFSKPGVLGWYRIKFGIYKGDEPDRRFVVSFRNIAVQSPGSLIRSR